MSDYLSNINSFNPHFGSPPPSSPASTKGTSGANQTQATAAQQITSTQSTVKSSIAAIQTELSGMRTTPGGELEEVPGSGTELKYGPFVISSTLGKDRGDLAAYYELYKTSEKFSYANKWEIDTQSLCNEIGSLSTSINQLKQSNPHAFDNADLDHINVILNKLANLESPTKTFTGANGKETIQSIEAFKSDYQAYLIALQEEMNKIG